MQAIQISNLTKRYGKARGVEEITLSIEEGEFFGFIGPNGAGKSTTIRSLTGLLSPTAGSARIFGEDCWTNRKKTLPLIGYLPSENSFYPGMKVKEVLKLSADLRGMNCSEEAGRLCEILQLDTAKKAAELSYGNRKKLSIVCALQHQPKLLILDEPTGGLDPLMQREFFRILDERHQQGATIFLSSHILSEVQKHCSRAAIIRNGRIIACDSVEKLVQGGVKKVSFTGQADLSGLEGIRNLVVQDGLTGSMADRMTGSTNDRMSGSADERTTAFLYSGAPDLLIKKLAGGTITDLSIQEPELEEVFMHYYEEV